MTTSPAPLLASARPWWRRLRWRIAATHALLVALAFLALGAYVEPLVQRRMEEHLREQLAAECRLVRAVLEAQPAQSMEPAVLRLAADSGARITVIAPSGKVLADSEAEPAHMDLHNTRIEVVDARRTGLGWSIRHSATVGQDTLYVAQSSGASAPTIRAALPLTRVRAASADLRRAIAAAAVVAAALAVLAGAWLARGVTGGLGEVTEAARQIGEGDLAARARVTTEDEVQDLAQVLNATAESLATARAGAEQSAARLRAILTHLADGVVVVSPDETIQLLNPAAALLLATDPGEARTRHLAEVVRHYELVGVVRRALRLRTLARAEVLTSDQPARTVAAAATPVEGDDGQLLGAVMALRDLTELQRLQQVRQDFIANASHELRTPVAAIRSLAETLNNGALRDPEAAPRFLRQIVANTESLAKLLDDMMALTRLEDVQHRPQPEALEVRDLLGGAAQRLAPQAEDQETRLDVEAPAGLQVWCAPDDLLTALVNLVDNAVKYAGEQNQVHLSAERAGDQVLISITDHGPGIPEADRERIFERFYRLDKGRSRALGGTGLGLSIVRHAVESNGGRVWVEAPAEGGARFVVALPAPPPASAADGTRNGRP